jgi:hypothetical protein
MNGLIALSLTNLVNSFKVIKDMNILYIILLYDKVLYSRTSRGIRFNACLSDNNGELITTYTAVKNNVKEVIRVLQTYETEYKRYPPYSKEQQEYYFQLRNARNNVKSRSDVEIAALLIALNKTFQDPTRFIFEPHLGQAACLCCIPHVIQ